MLFYFKKYLEKADPTITASSILGASLSVVAGVYALYNMCNGYSGCNDKPPLMRPIPERTPTISDAASVAALSAVVGSLAGYSAGLITSYVIAPIAEGFIGRCRGDVKKIVEIDTEQKNEDDKSGLDFKHNRP